MAPLQLAVEHLSLQLVGDLKGFRARLSSRKIQPGVHEVTVKLTAAQKSLPPPVELRFQQPITDIHTCWWTSRGRNFCLAPDWGHFSKLTAKATSLAPVICLHSQSGDNRLTFAVEDALHPVQLRTGVHEESARMTCGVQLIPEGYAPRKDLTVTVRLDFRRRPYYDILRDVAAWWAAKPVNRPAPVPDVGRRPMYSTWYSFHQVLEPAAVEAQCRLAKQLGCDAVIEDDGWQTLDSQRGYAFTGDWRPDRIPDMAGHVRRIHEAGLKVILWYAVPFIGRQSQAWSRFKDKFLNYKPDQQWSVLDPRFPDVREYLIQTYEQAVRDWDLDGFKLDFVDTFNAGPDDPKEAVGGRDYGAVDEAVDRLFTDVMARLRKLKPDMLIEFRQDYIGPLMRKYGNLFRAGDCPNDGIANRVRTLDLRLLCGDTAAHADMLMWHPDDPVESAALQLLNILFAVPQISVLIDKIPPAHRRMLEFWLGFWQTHRDCLLDGRLEPLHPELSYPVVRASTNSTRVLAVYSESAIAPLGPKPPALIHVVNASRADRVVLEVSEKLGPRRIMLRNTQGQILKQFKQSIAAGVLPLAIPPGGLATLER